MHESVGVKCQVYLMHDSELQCNVVSNDLQCSVHVISCSVVCDELQCSVQ